MIRPIDIECSVNGNRARSAPVSAALVLQAGILLTGFVGAHHQEATPSAGRAWLWEGSVRFPVPDAGSAAESASEPRVPEGFRVVKSHPSPGEEAQEAGVARAEGWAWKIEDPRTGIELVLVEAGKFLMGSPESDPHANHREFAQHEVTLTRPFYLSITEVTQAQWSAGLQAQAPHFQSLREHDPDRFVFDEHPSAAEGGDRPVELVRWIECAEFCAALGYRMPTEAEWEYACRAGTSTTYSFGDDSAALVDYGWHFTNFRGGRSHEREPQRVAVKNPNPWGLFDMHGNVWEWCEDVRVDSYPEAPMTDPITTRKDEWGVERIIRGGSFEQGHENARSAARAWYSSHKRMSQIGFRVVVPVDGDASEPEDEAVK